ncbi:hypothetical protein WJX72_003025 [[Myrmecia] bisecta]|uniref:Transcription factor Dp-1 n=1 Tax=[Myrmecia] bisecta TaxID=41462 RepID=A0AAW1PDX2_9CHLO
MDYSTAALVASPWLAGPLHDDLLRDFQETGMYDLAASMGIIQDGELPQVRMHALQQGNQLVAAADAAAAEAEALLETSRKRLKNMSDSSLGSPFAEADDAMNESTPQKGRAKKGGRDPRRSGDGSTGRNSGKGLRHFSLKVCEKVESKGRTTYNEVADELVQEFATAAANLAGSPGGSQYDEKNIRRRVYDALNVLMAMDIIAKEKKEISWKGLPTGQGNGVERLRAERARISTQIERQHQYLEELLKSQAALRNLVIRNKDVPVDMVKPNPDLRASPTALQLPFILIQAHQDATVEIQISEDSRAAHFDFHSTPFRIHGDDEVMKYIGLETANSGVAAHGNGVAQQAAAAQRQQGAQAGPHSEFRQQQGGLFPGSNAFGHGPCKQEDSPGSEMQQSPPSQGTTPQGGRVPPSPGSGFQGMDISPAGMMPSVGNASMPGLRSPSGAPQVNLANTWAYMQPGQPSKPHSPILDGLLNNRAALPGLPNGLARANNQMGGLSIPSLDATSKASQQMAQWRS